METPQKSNLTTDQSSALVRFIIYYAVHRKNSINDISSIDINFLSGICRYLQNLV